MKKLIIIFVMLAFVFTSYSQSIQDEPFPKKYQIARGEAGEDDLFRIKRLRNVFSLRSGRINRSVFKEKGIVFVVDCGEGRLPSDEIEKLMTPYEELVSTQKQGVNVAIWNWSGPNEKDEVLMIASDEDIYMAVIGYERWAKMALEDLDSNEMIDFVVEMVDDLVEINKKMDAKEKKKRETREKKQSIKANRKNR